MWLIAVYDGVEIKVNFTCLLSAFQQWVKECSTQKEKSSVGPPRAQHLRQTQHCCRLLLSPQTLNFWESQACKLAEKKTCIFTERNRRVLLFLEGLCAFTPSAGRLCPPELSWGHLAQLLGGAGGFAARCARVPLRMLHRCKGARGWGIGAGAVSCWAGCRRNGLLCPKGCSLVLRTHLQVLTFIWIVLNPEFGVQVRGLSLVQEPVHHDSWYWGYWVRELVFGVGTCRQERQVCVCFNPQRSNLLTCYVQL